MYCRNACPRYPYIRVYRLHDLTDGEWPVEQDVGLDGDTVVPDYTGRATKDVIHGKFP